MKHDRLSKEEDVAFTEKVIAYNFEKDPIKKKQLSEGIQKRTKELIYLISLKYLLMSEDEAAAVYLECEKELDRIISSFRIATCTYNCYLLQTCRFRARRIQRAEYKYAIVEDWILHEDAQGYYLEDKFNEEVFDTLRPCSPMLAERIKEMNMKELFLYIVNNANRKDYQAYTMVEYALRKELKSIPTRKKFVAFLLTLPDNLTEKEIQDYARVCQTEEDALHCLFQKRRDILSLKVPDCSESMDLVNKHWRLMGVIRKTIRNETNSTKVRALQENYRVQARCHRNRLLDAKKSHRGMSHQEIADILGTSRTTITVWVNSMYRILEELAKTYSIATKGDDV